MADPLSADLITMSLRLLSDLRACRSREVKLSRTGSGFMLRTSCSTASKKVSSAIFAVGRRSPSAFRTKWVRIGLGVGSHENIQGDACDG